MQTTMGRWTNRPPVLCPAGHSNPDETRLFSHAILRQRLARWKDDIDLRDESGQPVRATAHQISTHARDQTHQAGRRPACHPALLGHASPQMTARYASLHDTVRKAFDEYCEQRVNLRGERIVYDPTVVTADAEWTKHNLVRL